MIKVLLAPLVRPFGDVDLIIIGSGNGLSPIKCQAIKRVIDDYRQSQKKVKQYTNIFLDENVVCKNLTIWFSFTNGCIIHTSNGTDCQLVDYQSWRMDAAKNVYIP